MALCTSSISENEFLCAQVSDLFWFFRSPETVHFLTSEAAAGARSLPEGSMACAHVTARDHPSPRGTWMSFYGLASCARGHPKRQQGLALPPTGGGDEGRAAGSPETHRFHARHQRHSTPLHESEAHQCSPFCGNRPGRPLYPQELAHRCSAPAPAPARTVSLPKARGSAPRRPAGLDDGGVCAMSPWPRGSRTPRKPRSHAGPGFGVRRGGVTPQGC